MSGSIVLLASLVLLIAAGAVVAVARRCFFDVILRKWHSEAALN